MLKKTVFAGLGFFVPPNTVSNEDLTEKVNTTDRWIRERSGIEERHYVVAGQETNLSMAAEASRRAMKMADITAEEIDLIVFATLSPDYQFPGTGTLLQHELGCRTIGAIDVRAQCSGFVYGLSIADQFIKTGMYQTVLLVGSEIQSNALDFSDHGRHIAVLFGDGAGAAVLKASDDPDRGILSTHLHSQGEFARSLAILEPSYNKKNNIYPGLKEPGGPGYPVMEGQLVFKNAVKRFPEVIREALAANELTLDDLDMLVPHQANLRISQFVQKKLKLRDEQIVNNIQKYGNTTAASIPIALSEAVHDERIKQGDLVCLATFGSGFTWSSALIRW
ncbi:MAG: 3-oxoacyl-ACP synthase [Acidobacteria bacterium]|nr:MAG: 3-oxoacyl-ACP synthase [Acidobacteriota bacterium]